MLVDTDCLPADPGTYLLLLRSARGGFLKVGSLGTMELRSGYYLYVGSACGPGGISGRVSRHLSGTSRAHWHIDYLRQQSDPAAVWFRADRSRREHRWAGLLASVSALDVALPRFGASDCRCRTHLFFTRTVPSLQSLRNWLSEGPVVAGGRVIVSA